MSVTVYVPGEAAALALGADSVAAAARRGIDIQLVRAYSTPNWTVIPGQTGQ